MKGVVPSHLKFLTPGSKCIVLVRMDGLWFNDLRFGVSIYTKLIVFHPGPRRIGVSDLLVTSSLVDMEEEDE